MKTSHFAKIAALIVPITFVIACQEYPAQPDDGLQGKVCDLSAYRSSITMQYTGTGTLPSQLSASVNGLNIVNDCVGGNEGPGYTIVRTGSSTATLVLWAQEIDQLRETYFRADGTPKSDQVIDLKIFGRGSCSDNPSQIYQSSRALQWQAIKGTSSQGECIKGYNANVSL